MPFFKLNEACNCGSKSCPECNGKKDKKKAVKEDAFDKSIFKLGEECACGKDNCNCGQGVSTGVAKADGLLHKIPVNQLFHTLMTRNRAMVARPALDRGITMRA